MNGYSSLKFLSDCLVEESDRSSCAAANVASIGGDKTGWCSTTSKSSTQPCIAGFIVLVCKVQTSGGMVDGML